jgi:hypothetical protein
LPGWRAQEDNAMVTPSNPFSIFFPGAENLRQFIDTRWWSPTITVNYAGNPAVEREVTEEVASPGKQIGWLNEIVTALVKNAGEEKIARDPKAADALKKFKDAQGKIEEIKKRRQANALAEAREALARLGAADKTAYAHLVRSLDPKNPPKDS